MYMACILCFLAWPLQEHSTKESQAKPVPWLPCEWASKATCFFHDSLVSCHFQSPLRNQRICKQPTVHNDHMYRQKLSIIFEVNIMLVSKFANQLSVLFICLSVCLSDSHSLGLPCLTELCVDLPVYIPSIHQSGNYFINQTISKSVDHSAYQSLNQPVSQTVRQTIN